MTVGILGSGFGLYGYLPALVGLGHGVRMPARARERLLGRAELRHLFASVEWVEDDEHVLEGCEALVIARRPSDQVRWARRVVATPGIRCVLLEKPVAEDPATARSLLLELEAAGKTVGIGFTFRYTAWARALKASLREVGSEGSLAVDWRFRAHHYAANGETWKRRPSQGGGSVRFYGIHLIALLAELGYGRAKWSRVEGEGGDDARCWEALLTGPAVPPCRLLVNSDDGERLFRVEASGPSSPFRIALADPFDDVPVNGMLDRRVDVLSQLCRDVLGDAAVSAPWYRRSTELWSEVERCTTTTRLA